MSATATVCPKYEATWERGGRGWYLDCEVQVAPRPAGQRGEHGVLWGGRCRGVTGGRWRPWGGGEQVGQVMGWWCHAAGCRGCCRVVLQWGYLLAGDALHPAQARPLTEDLHLLRAASGPIAVPIPSVPPGAQCRTAGHPCPHAAGHQHRSPRLPCCSCWGPPPRTLQGEGP